MRTILLKLPPTRIVSGDQSGSVKLGNETNRNEQGHRRLSRHRLRSTGTQAQGLLRRGSLIGIRPTRTVHSAEPVENSTGPSSASDCSSDRNHPCVGCRPSRTTATSRRPTSCRLRLRIVVYDQESPLKDCGQLSMSFICRGMTERTLTTSAESLEAARFVVVQQACPSCKQPCLETKKQGLDEPPSSLAKTGEDTTAAHCAARDFNRTSIS